MISVVGFVHNTEKNPHKTCVLVFYGVIIDIYESINVTSTRNSFKFS